MDRGPSLGKAGQLYTTWYRKQTMLHVFPLVVQACICSQMALVTVAWIQAFPCVSTKGKHSQGWESDQFPSTGI